MMNWFATAAYGIQMIGPSDFGARGDEVTIRRLTTWPSGTR